MSLSDFIPDQPLPFIPQAVGTALAAVITQLGLSALTSPTKFTKTFGIPENHNNPYVRAFAARELTLGLISCVFAARKEWYSLGVVGSMMAICGITDGLLVGNYGDGWNRAWKVHLLPTILVAPASWYLVLN